MGKTKTAIVSGLEGDNKSSAQKYKEKVEKRSEKIHLPGLKGGQRIKMIEPEVVKTSDEEPSEALAKEAGKVPREPKVRGKKYLKSKSQVDKSKTYPLPEALKLVKQTSYSKFDGTMELHLAVRKVGIGAQVDLPYSTGKVKKVEIADEETLKKIQGGKVDFDVLLATAEMMPKLIPFAKILGPKGLMPNPKNGTIVKSTKDAAKFSGNTINLKTEKEAPLIHTVIGKVSQKDSELAANLEAIIKAIGDKQIVKAYLKATMGPAVKLALT